MEFISPEEAAEKWGISRRTVRQYLEKDRIPGVQKAGRRVLIPANAEKPDDLRRKENRIKGAPLAINPFVLTVADYKPGFAKEYVNNVLDPEKKLIGMAELAFLRGETENAVSLCKELESSQRTDTLVGVMLVKALSSLYIGSVDYIIENYRLLHNISKIASNVPQFKKTGDFLCLYFNIMIHNAAAITFPDVGIDAFAVSQELKPMSVYAYSRWLLITGNINRAIGLSEGALVFMSEMRPVSAVYLALVVSDGYIITGNWKKAEYYFRLAWNTALPDGIITPFSEFRYLLCGLLEKCLRYDYPEEYRKIIALSNTYFTNWTSAHNAITGDILTDKLTPMEFNIATLAARGVSNEIIAENLTISVNSVRTHLRNVFNKLNISSRKELTRYLLH